MKINYSEIYLNTIITLLTLKSIIPLAQNQLFNKLGVNSYQELTDKISFQNSLNNELNRIKLKVLSITDNLQYQSWIYKILKNQNKSIDKNYTLIKNIINQFTRLSRNPDLTALQKNINNYPTFQNLAKFVLSFDNRLTGDKSLYKDLKFLYQNNSFTCYLIKNYQTCHHLFGKEADVESDCIFNTNWCVAKNQLHFDDYINFYKDHYNGYIVFIDNKTNKPYALLHYGSNQFKDVNNNPLEDNNPDIIDALIQLNNNLSDYKNDLEFYGYFIYNLNHPKSTKLAYYLSQVLAVIDLKNKIINFGKKQPRITDDIIKELNGIFNYTIKSANPNWSNLFYNCKSLKLIGLNFIIPDHVNSCFSMFYHCALQYLPLNFTIPNSVKDCMEMFYSCKSLLRLPLNFIIPDSVKYCSHMFYNCRSLEKLPLNFTLSNSIIICSGMFSDCVSLKLLPYKFRLTESIEECNNMFSNCTSLKQLSDYFTIPKSVKNCSFMFSNCISLQLLSDYFAIHKSVENCNNMFSNCTSLKQKPIIPKSIKYQNNVFS